MSRIPEDPEHIKPDQKIHQIFHPTYQQQPMKMETNSPQPQLSLAPQLSIPNKTKYTPQEIKGVHSLIERCIRAYMTLQETLVHLHVFQNVSPNIIALVWQKLEDQNPEFFKAYYLRLKVKDQMSRFNELINKQAEMMHNKMQEMRREQMKYQQFQEQQQFLNDFSYPNGNSDVTDHLEDLNPHDFLNLSQQQYPHQMQTQQHQQQGMYQDFPVGKVPQQQQYQQQYYIPPPNQQQIYQMQMNQQHQQHQPIQMNRGGNQQQNNSNIHPNSQQVRQNQIQQQPQQAQTQQGQQQQQPNQSNTQNSQNLNQSGNGTLDIDNPSNGLFDLSENPLGILEEDFEGSFFLPFNGL